MITALWIAGYVLGALIVGRVLYVTRAFEDRRGEVDGFPLLFSIAVWPVVVPLAALLGAGLGIMWLVTLPTTAERRAKRMDQAERERDHIRREAKRLGLPLLEEDR